MNYIILQGHLTADPVYRQGQNGKQNSIWGKIGVYQGKDQNGNDLPSMFVEFTAFGKEADTIAQFAHKGDLIIASGRFSETQSQGQDGRTYTNKRIIGNAKMCYKMPSNTQPQQNFNQQVNQAMNNMGMNQQPQQYQNNQSMWG